MNVKSGYHTRILRDVLEEHFEEVLWLTSQRCQAVEDPSYNLNDLADLDDRVEAHVDGLRVAMEDQPVVAWKTCEACLELGEPEAIFPVAILACERTDESIFARVLELAKTDATNSRALVDALAWMPHSDLVPTLQVLLGDQDSSIRRIGLSVSVAHRLDPGQALIEALEHSDVNFRVCALRAIGILGRGDLLHWLKTQLHDRNSEVSFAAAWATARLVEFQSATDRLLEAVEALDEKSDIAAQILARRLPPDRLLIWLLNFLDNETSMVPTVSPSDRHERIRLTIKTLGYIGVIDWIPWLLEMMEQPAWARIAGESFTLISGLELENQYQADGPGENHDNENSMVDRDGALSFPNVSAVVDWWTVNSKKFVNGQRYLLGELVSKQWCQNILRNGNQHHRLAASVELSVMNPNEPIFDIRARACWQQLWFS